MNSDRGLDGLRGVLAFATVRDFEELRPDDVKRWRRVIGEVAGGAGALSRSVAAHVHGWRAKIEADLPWGDARARAQTVRRLRTLQAEVQPLLDGLFPADGFGDAPGWGDRIPAVTTGLHLQRTNAGANPPVELVFIVKNWRSAFWVGFAALLEEWGQRVNRCAKCHALYLKARKELYCSARCSGAMRAQRYYHTHKSRSKAKPRKRPKGGERARQ